MHTYYTHIHKQYLHMQKRMEERGWKEWERLSLRPWHGRAVTLLYKIVQVCFSPPTSFFAVSPVQAAQLFRTGATEPQPRRSRMILAADAHISWSSYHPSVCWVRLVLELGAVRATAPGERHGTLCTDRLDERWYFVGSSWFCAIQAKPRKFQLPRVWWCSQY